MLVPLQGSPSSTMPPPPSRSAHLKRAVGERNNTCLAANLPEEILLYIFHFIREDFRLSYVARVLMVCRRWLGPARCTLYEHLTPMDTVTFLFLYESLKYIRPENRVLVRSLNMLMLGYYIWSSDDGCVEPTRTMQFRLLDILPNLIRLNTPYIIGERDLDKISKAASIRSLKIHCLAMEHISIEKIFDNGIFKRLPHLKSLTFFKYSLDLEDRSCSHTTWKEEIRTPLPNLETLRFQDMNINPSALSNWLNLARSMPSLRRLEFEVAHASFFEQEVCLQQLTTLAPNLNHLVLELPYWPETCWIAKLTNLRNLDCTFTQNCSIFINSTPQYPQNVERLFIRWRCYEPRDISQCISVQALPFLESLANPTSFPRLLCCPNLRLQCSNCFDIDRINRPVEQEKLHLPPALHSARERASKALQARSPSVQCWHANTPKNETIEYDEWLTHIILSSKPVE